MCFLFVAVVRCRFLFVFFFFSSRRRHTRLVSDWSSDVCSSDLESPSAGHRPCADGLSCPTGRVTEPLSWRSEERRVGKECRSRWSPDQEKKKKRKHQRKK